MADSLKQRNDMRDYWPDDDGGYESFCPSALFFIAKCHMGLWAG